MNFIRWLFLELLPDKSKWNYDVPPVYDKGWLEAQAKIANERALMGVTDEKLDDRLYTSASYKPTKSFNERYGKDKPK